FHRQGTPLHPELPIPPLGPSDWILISILLGGGLGMLFTPFLGGDESPNGRFLALVGIITFASGAAFLLNLSPVAVNLALGAVLVNAARTGQLIGRTLVATERPMELVLLVLAGVLFRPPEWRTFLV